MQVGPIAPGTQWGLLKTSVESGASEVLASPGCESTRGEGGEKNKCQNGGTLLLTIAKNLCQQNKMCSHYSMQ